MQTILKNIIIADTTNPLNGQVIDILIEDSKIKQIGHGLLADEKDEIHDCQGMFALPGCLDVNTFIGFPGFEEKESPETLNDAALQGGFTALASRADLNPAIDNAGQIKFLKETAKQLNITIYPIGSISKGLKGESLAELYDMHQTGAVAFSDAKKTKSGIKLMSLAMQYVKSFHGKLLFFADENDLSRDGQMNEGITSIHLGMKGVPKIAEKMGVQKILDLAAYNESAPIFFGISTAEALDEIRKAKLNGQEVYAGIFAHHLYFDETKLMGFDSNFKIKPPLRTQKDIEALIEGIKDKTIDFISADHCPENIENKAVEFEYAASGMTGLETALSASWTILQKHIDLNRFSELWSLNNRAMLNINVPKIAKGEFAEITIFNPNQSYTFEPKHQKSASKNSAYFGETFTGKTFGVFSKGAMHLSEN